MIQPPDRARVGASARPPAEKRPLVAISADFIPLFELELPCDVRIVRAGRGKGAAVIRTELPERPLIQFIDSLLAAGYPIRRGLATEHPGGRVVNTYYVRPPMPALGQAVRASGSITVDPGVVGTFPLVSQHEVHLGRGSCWTAPVEATDRIVLEPEAIIAGPVVTPGELVLHEGARVQGLIRAGSLRVEGPGRGGTGRTIVPIPVEPTVTWEEMDPVPSAAEPAPPEPPQPVEAPPPPQEPAQAVDEEALWDAKDFPGSFRVLARASPDAAEVPKFLRGRQAPTGPGAPLEIEVLEASGSTVGVLLHPGAKEASRISAPMEDLRLDQVASTLMPIREKLSYLRVSYATDGLEVRASTESVRWLIMLLGKMVRIHTRLGRLREMRLRVPAPGGIPIQPKP